MESDGNYFHTFYFQAFSDQFALVSEEVGHLAEEGESLLSKGKVDGDGALSAKLQDVRQRFIRIQELVEKQKEYERFENAAHDYKTRMDAIANRLSSGFQYDGDARDSAEVILSVYAIFVLCSVCDVYVKKVCQLWAKCNDLDAFSIYHLLCMLAKIIDTLQCFMLGESI